MNPALQISDKANDQEEYNIQNDQYDSETTAEDVSWSSINGTRLMYGITVATIALSLLVIFMFSREGLKDTFLHSLHFDSQHNRSVSSKKQAVQFSTAIELKNGCVQVTLIVP